MPDEKPRYCAFVSYSWKDKIWGERLHRWLETYQVPKGILGAPGHGRRLGKFFRDDEDMAASGDIGAIVREAIERSDHMIVLCSPHSAASQWVHAEIEAFRKANPTGEVFAVIISGTPNAADPSQECFPPALRVVVDRNNPDAMPIEPVGVDLRRDGRARACARIAAGVLRVDFDELWRRDRRRAEQAQRVRLGVLGGLTATFAALMVAAIVNAFNAHVTLSRFFAERAWEKMEAGETLEAARYALAGWAVAPQNEPLYRAALGSALFQAGESPPALLHAAGVNEGVFSPDGVHVVTAGWDKVARIWRAETGEMEGTLAPGAGEVLAVAYSGDGRLIATGSEDGPIFLWDADSHRQIAKLDGHADAILRLEFFPDNGRLLSHSDDHSIRIWDLATRKANVLDGAGALYTVALSPDGRWVAASGDTGEVILYDVERAKISERLADHRDAVYGAAFSPDSKQIVTFGAELVARVWSVPDGRRITVLEGHRLEIYNAGFSPDGRRVVTASRDLNAMLWSASDGRPLATLDGHANYVTHSKFSPDGQWIVTAGLDRTVRVWDARDGSPAAVLRGHAGAITSIQISSDSQTILTTGADGRTRLWPLRGSGLLAKVSMGGAPLHHVEFVGDRGVLMAADRSGAVQVWDTENWSPGGRIAAHDGEIFSLSLSRKGDRLLTAGVDGLRLWDALGARLPVSGSPSDGVRVAGLSPERDRIATGGTDGAVVVRDALTGAALDTLVGHTDMIRGITFSPDGQRLATASEDWTSRIWDASSGAELFVLSQHRLGVGGVSFSSDGGQVVTSSDDGTAIVWDARTGKMRLELAGHVGGVYSAVFSPDGRLIATASEDKTARVWDARDGRLMATFDSHDAPVFGVAFSPDGTRLATASEDGFARVWSVRRLIQPWDELASAACKNLLGEPGRRFSLAEIQSDPLLMSEWRNPERDVCRRVRTTPDP